MNSTEIREKIQLEINEICETNRRRYRRQYPITKWARVELEKLGLWEMVQAWRHGSAGQSDAQDILKACGWTTDGLGDDWQAWQGVIGNLLAQLRREMNAEKITAALPTNEVLVLVADPDTAAEIVAYEPDEDGVYPTLTGQWTGWTGEKYALVVRHA